MLNDCSQRKPQTVYMYIRQIAVSNSKYNWLRFKIKSTQCAQHFLIIFPFFEIMKIKFKNLYLTLYYFYNTILYMIELQLEILYTNNVYYNFKSYLMHLIHFP